MRHWSFNISRLCLNVLWSSWWVWFSVGADLSTTPAWANCRAAEYANDSSLGRSITKMKQADGMWKKTKFAQVKWESCWEERVKPTYREMETFILFFLCLPFPNCQRKEGTHTHTLCCSPVRLSRCHSAPPLRLLVTLRFRVSIKAFNFLPPTLPLTHPLKCCALRGFMWFSAATSRRRRSTFRRSSSENHSIWTIDQVSLFQQLHDERFCCVDFAITGVNRIHSLKSMSMSSSLHNDAGRKVFQKLVNKKNLSWYIQ